MEEGGGAKKGMESFVGAGQERERGAWEMRGQEEILLSYLQLYCRLVRGWDYHEKNIHQQMP